MSIIIDTSIWSLALRRKNISNDLSLRHLQMLIEHHKVKMLGAIRQELLSGISNVDQFDKLKLYLHAFPDIKVNTADYETAAEFYNSCKSNGIQGSNTDFLICAVAYLRKMQIFTNDNDFAMFKKIIPIELYTYSHSG